VLKEIEGFRIVRAVQARSGSCLYAEADFRDRRGDL